MDTVPFLSLHALAAARGDGLRPEFLAMFERLAAASGAGPPVVSFDRYQRDGVLQSGPISVLPDDPTLPEGVSRFPAGRDLPQSRQNACPRRGEDHDSSTARSGLLDRTCPA